jgi:hypothetical protein
MVSSARRSSCPPPVRTRAAQRRQTAVAWFALAFLGSACSGQVVGAGHDEPSAGAGTSAGRTSGRGGTSSGGSSAGGSGGAQAACDAIAPSPVRRLSRSEYTNTLRDLFPGIDVGQPELTPDPALLGFENRASNLFATEDNVAQFQKAAVAVAGKAVGAIAQLLPCASTGDAACASKFLDDFGSRAFRRPLTSTEKARWQAFFDKQKADIDFKSAVQLTVEAMLQAPQFLYRADFGDGSSQAGRVRPTDWEMASRLSYLLWGSMPDAALFAAAHDSKLHDDASIAAAAERMVKDGKARGQLVDFYRQWLDYDHITAVYQREGDKDPARYAAYTPDLRAAMREESDRFTGYVMTESTGTLKELLTSRETFVNAPLADLYGVAKPASGWQKATLPANRAGLLTQGSFLASHAHKVAGSPPLRAAFVMQRLLCLPRQAPPADANTTEPVSKTGDAPMTNRQLFEQRVNEQTKCQACHKTMDPIGFPFESFDAIGRYREMDNGLPVDPSGALSFTDVDGKVANATELVGKLGDSRNARACMTSRWLEFAIGQTLDDGVDDCRAQRLTDALDAAKGDVRALLLALVKSPDFLYRMAP